jgi:signal peptidase I
MIKRELPKRGDVVVFKYPKDESLYYIKRVIGVPGDTVEMQNKVLYINHHRIEQVQIENSQSEKALQNLGDPEYPIGQMDLYTETLDSVNHTIMIDKTGFRSENFGPIAVPPESLFVMGDNRDFSGDSRFWGFVPMKNVKGKAMVIWLSLWASFSDHLFSFRPSRIGTLIQ